MKHSETLGKLAPALAKAQAQLKPAVKDSDNPFFKSKYADLSSVWEACREPLKANGLSVVQGHGTEGGPHGHIWTMLLHESGEYLMGECPIVLGSKVDPQALGSATTYTRRYALAAIMGVTQEDDDGNAAAQPAAKTIPKAQSKPDDKAVLDWLAAFEEATTAEQLAETWWKVPKHLQANQILLNAKNTLKAKLNGGK